MTAVAPARTQSWWRPLVRAMGQTGGASLASGLLSALAIKIVATLAGPGPIALVQTLQQVRDGAVNLATANGRTALVQGASALGGVERREYLRTVAVLFSGATLLVAAGMLAAPSIVARWARLPAESETLLPWLALTVALLSVFVFLTAMLTALREIGKLALVQLASPFAAALIAWPLAIAARAGHPLALVFFLAIPAALSIAAAAIACRGLRFLESFRGTGQWWSVPAARGFLSLSGAMLASGLVATTVLLAVRGSITRSEGLTMTGQFDAAWNISMNHVTLILSSVQAYYLPALAAAKSAAERTRQMRGMLLVATLAVVPVIVSLQALKPLAIHLFYSTAFQASPGFLRWTLIGDYLKVSAWVLATPMLATCDVGAFLASDMAAHAVFFGAAALLARFVKPSEGAALGFLISCAVYLALCFGYARLRHGFHFGAVALTMWLTGLLLILGASADTTISLTRASVWIALASSFTAGFGMYFRRREV